MGREPELAGQTVVVLGGSAGIGLETARQARAEGVGVVLTARDPERLKQAALEVGTATTSKRAATSSARRSPSGAWSGRPTSPPSPCTS